jgi:hypothetical protein
MNIFLRDLAWRTRCLSQCLIATTASASSAVTYVGRSTTGLHQRPWTAEFSIDIEGSPFSSRVHHGPLQKLTSKAFTRAASSFQRSQSRRFAWARRHQMPRWALPGVRRTLFAAGV